MFVEISRVSSLVAWEGGKTEWRETVRSFYFVNIIKFAIYFSISFQICHFSKKFQNLQQIYFSIIFFVIFAFVLVHVSEK